jgi:hypothetical protein
MRERPSTAWRVLSTFKDRLTPLRETPAPPKTKESPLAELAEQLGHVYTAAQAGEPVTFWLILNEQTTARSVRLAWAHTAPSGEQTYTHSKAFRWDAADPEIVDPKERIGFKALCHLIQATGLPFLGVNSPLNPDITGMDALLSSKLTWMLNAPVFLQCHHGSQETTGRPGGKQRSVRGQFEKLKTLAPEHFAHLQFPTGYEMD